MHVTLGQAWEYLYGNKVAILSAVSVAYLVFVKTMPPPTISWRNREVLKTFFYNYTHVLSHQDALPYPQLAPYPKVTDPKA